MCLSLTGDLPSVRSGRQGFCVCLSLTGDLPSVWSGRQGFCVCLSLTGDLPSVRSGRQGLCTCVCMCIYYLTSLWLQLCACCWVVMQVYSVIVFCRGKYPDGRNDQLHIKKKDENGIV